MTENPFKSPEEQAAGRARRWPVSLMVFGVGVVLASVGLALWHPSIYSTGIGFILVGGVPYLGHAAIRN